MSAMIDRVRKFREDSSGYYVKGRVSPELTAVYDEALSDLIAELEHDGIPSSSSVRKSTLNEVESSIIANKDRFDKDSLYAALSILCSLRRTTMPISGGH